MAGVFVTGRDRSVRSPTLPTRYQKVDPHSGRLKWVDFAGWRVAMLFPCVVCRQVGAACLVDT